MMMMSTALVAFDNFFYFLFFAGLNHRSHRGWQGNDWSLDDDGCGDSSLESWLLIEALVDWIVKVK